MAPELFPSPWRPGYAAAACSAEGEPVMRRIAGLTVTLLASVLLLPLGPRDAAADATELRITRQPSILYLQEVLMEEKKLIEKHAAALGLNDLKISWQMITS